MTIALKAAHQTFDVMSAAIADMPHLLVSFRDDFLHCDREYLARTAYDGAQYCWFVRPSGTHLALVGVHQRLSAVEQTYAAIQACDSPESVVFHLKAGRARMITKEQALALLSTGHATCRDGQIIYRSRQLARYHVASRYCQEQDVNLYDVYLDSDGASYDTEDLVVLYELAQMLARMSARSLFTHIDRIIFDTENLGDLIDRCCVS